MNRNKFVRFSIFGLVLLIATACEPYNNYIKDFGYSAVYFGTQKPLRTLVARDNKSTLDFKLGVVLSGVLENKQNQWVKIEIDTTLFSTIAGADVFELLPEEWYNFDIEENKIIIPKNKFLGDFTISINKEKFTNDPASLNNTYALPVRITETSADSILQGNEIIAGKDYTMLVVKYISEHSGVYYIRGEQVELDANGNEIVSTKVEYYKQDWSQNKVRNFETVGVTSCEMNGVGNNDNQKMILKFSPENQISLESSTLTINGFSSTYDKAQSAYNFQYTYDLTGKTFKVNEYLKHRNDPEKDLRFEEWN